MSSTGPPTTSDHTPGGRSTIVDAASALDLIGRPLLPQVAYAASAVRVMGPTRCVAQRPASSHVTGTTLIVDGGPSAI